MLRGCRAGEPASWEALVRKYRHLVYSIPHRAGLRPEDCSDVFQTVFATLLLQVDRLRQEETLIPWLVTTARRESWKTARKAGREMADDETARSERGADPVDPFEDEELLARQVAVRSALDRLDERCRRLLTLLFYEEGRSYARIAEAMSLPVPSIGPTRQRCLDKLRRQLGPTGAPA